MTFEVSTFADLINAAWDLRDRAYDNPDQWKRVEAEAVFQALGEVLEAENEREDRADPPTWGTFALLLRQAADRAVGYTSPT